MWGPEEVLAFCSHLWPQASHNLFQLDNLSLPIWTLVRKAPSTEKSVLTRVHDGSGLERPPEGQSFQSVNQEKRESHEFQQNFWIGVRRSEP